MFKIPIKNIGFAHAEWKKKNLFLCVCCAKARM